MRLSGMSDKERKVIRRNLVKSHDFADAAVFRESKERSIDLLEKAWIRFLKRDFNNFHQSVVTPIAFNLSDI